VPKHEASGSLLNLRQVHTTGRSWGRMFLKNKMMIQKLLESQEG
jgi:hypothetical protein